MVMVKSTMKVCIVCNIIAAFLLCSDSIACNLRKKFQLIVIIKYFFFFLVEFVKMMMSK